MKHIFTLLFSIIILITSAQPGYQIKIKTEVVSADSLFVKAYNTKDKKFKKFLSLKFENDLTIKDKKPLDAGIYIIEADSILLSEFLISDEKNQKFSFSFLKDDVKVEGSKENSANLAFTRQMMEFERQLAALDNEFREMQQKIPNYMMQPFVDSLAKKADNIFVEKRAYQKKVIAENKGSLLASIIQCSLVAPQPPKEYMQDRVKFFSYSAEHLFDTFTWEDERLLSTPVMYNKLKTFAQQIIPLPKTIAAPIVLKVLHDSKKNKKMYYAFFDYLEHDFGSYKSPYRDELLYMEMLKDILSEPFLEETRKMRYEYELNLISRNQPGDQAIDFNVLLSSGDTTTLYDIDAEILILYFQNPDCPTCGEFREKMKNMESLGHAINVGKVKVLTVYFEENESLWHNYLKTKAFNSWMQGWNSDLQFSEKALYECRVIPMIMILDKGKKVIKKDIFPDELEEWLKRNL
jgi:hypothetical protein